jgi:DHA2 family multidrug resistance protein
MSAVSATASDAHIQTPHRALIIIFVMMSTAMPLIDSTIANIVLPHMQGSLVATQDQISWVLTTYIVTAAVVTPATGWITGRIGRRNLFFISVSVFTFSSMLCGIATSLEEMLLYRILQGASGATLLPMSQAVLLDISPTEKHGQSMAIWSLGVMLGPILGPTLGGWLAEYYNWRWVFYINLPVGILTLLGLWAYLPDTEREERRFDKFGFLTLALAVSAFQLMLDRGHREEWFASTEITIYALVMAASLWMFVVHTLHTSAPFFRLDLFKDRNFSTCFAFTFFIHIVLMGVLVLLPSFLQVVMGYQVIDAGVLLAARGIGVIMAVPFTGRLLGKVDARLFILTGLIFVTLALYEMTKFSAFVPQERIFLVSMVNGFGIGLLFVPLSTVAFSTLAQKMRAEATSFYNLMRSLGSSVGISIMVTLLARNIQVNHAYLAEEVSRFKSGLPLEHLPPPYSYTSGELARILDSEVTRQAATIAYVNDFQVMMILLIILMPFVFFLRPAKILVPARKEENSSRQTPEKDLASGQEEPAAPPV